MSDIGYFEHRVSGIRICRWLRKDCGVVIKGGAGREEVLTEMVALTKVVTEEVVGVVRLQISLKVKLTRFAREVDVSHERRVIKGHDEFGTRAAMGIGYRLPKRRRLGQEQVWAKQEFISRHVNLTCVLDVHVEMWGKVV